MRKQKQAKPGFRVLMYLVSCLIIAFGVTVSGNGGQKSTSVAFADVTQTAQFAWHANRPGVTRAQIALGRATTLRFEFTVKNAEGRQVMFGIPKEYVQMGISIIPKQVTIKNGMAQAKAEFQCPPGMPLGKFNMLVVMVDAKTKKEMGRGIIQFMLLPAGVGGC